MDQQQTNQALVTIIGANREEVPLPNPTTYSGSTSTMVDSGTNISGHLLGAVVREDVAQVALSWNYLSAQEWAKINHLFKENFINTVCFFDQTLGQWTERDMYVGDRGAGLWRLGADGSILGWTNCSLQLTEV